MKAPKAAFSEPTEANKSVPQNPYPLPPANLPYSAPQDIYPDNWWYCRQCLCCISLRTAVKVIFCLYIFEWAGTAVTTFYTLSYAGGSNWTPGNNWKYFSLLTYLGTMIGGLGLTTAVWTSYNKQFMGREMIYLKLAGHAVTLIGNIISLAIIPKVLPMRRPDFSMLVVAIIIWLLVELYFVLILKSFSVEPEVMFSVYPSLPANYPAYINNGPRPAQGLPYEYDPRSIPEGRVCNPAYGPPSNIHPTTAAASSGEQFHLPGAKGA